MTSYWHWIYIGRVAFILALDIGRVAFIPALYIGMMDFLLGCPLISLQSKTKRNGSENEQSEIEKKMISFACLALK